MPLAGRASRLPAQPWRQAAWGWSWRGPCNNPVRDFLKGAGWGVMELEFGTSSFGELLARRRWCLMGFAQAGAEVEAEQALAALQMPVGAPCGSALRPAREVPEADWVEVDRSVHDPRMAVARGQLEPRGAAHAWIEGRKQWVPGAAGPLWWPKFGASGREKQLVVDVAAPAGRVRLVTASELWSMMGREASWLEAAVEGLGVEEAVRRGCRAAGARTAGALALALGLAAQGTSRAGACRDPDAGGAARALAAWLRHWRQGHFSTL